MKKRIASTILNADRTALNNLTGLAAYAPRRPSFTTEKAVAANDAILLLQTKVDRLRSELAVAIDTITEAEHLFHDIMLGAKDEVIAQFGASSDEVQALGLKRRSDRRAPKRRTVIVTKS
jgi:hypothetical protein